MGDKMKKKLLQDLAKKYNINIADLNTRLDGRIEWICEHGVGHTIWFPENSSNIHGCDGCCAKLVKPA